MILPVRRRDFCAATLVLALSVAFLLWARSYPGTPGAMPVLVAWATIALALVDVVSQFETPFGRWLRRLVNADKIIEWKMEGEEDIPLGRIVLSIGWVTAYLAALFLVGFILVTPVYIFLYMIIHGGRSLRDSALAAAAITLTIWLVFVVLFRYPLYTGLLFGGY